jgi:hypothetical protein
MYSINSSVQIDMLDHKGLNLVVIGNGSFSMIKSYRSTFKLYSYVQLTHKYAEIFKSPYKVYTDPSMHVYSALGMTMRTTDAGPSNECGEYVKRGLVGGIAMVVKNALKSRLPVWEKGGDIKQLGGEFVLGPGFVALLPFFYFVLRSLQVEMFLRASNAHYPFTRPCIFGVGGCWPFPT